MELIFSGSEKLVLSYPLAICPRKICLDTFMIMFITFRLYELLFCSSRFISTQS